MYRIEIKEKIKTPKSGKASGGYNIGVLPKQRPIKSATTFYNITIKSVYICIYCNSNNSSDISFNNILSSAKSRKTSGGWDSCACLG